MENIKLNLQVTNSNGEPIKRDQVNVSSSMSISALKGNCADKYGGDIQSVRFNGQTLSDDKNCKFYIIQDGATLEIIINKPDSQINLIVEVQSETGNQKPISVKVDPNMTKEDLINVLRKKMSFSFEYAQLTYHGKALVSGVSLKDQDVRNNDVIHVVMKARGG